MARIYSRQLFRFTRASLPPPSKYIDRCPSPFCSFAEPDLSLDARNPPRHNRCHSLLQSCQSMRELVQIHGHLITSGLFNHHFWANRVLLQASEFGDIVYTVLIFKLINVPNAFCINRVIKAYSLSSDPLEAVFVYFQWLGDGFRPDTYTFLSLFCACASIGCGSSGRKCHGQAFKNGVDCVMVLRNSLIHMYGCCGHIELGRKVFDEMLTLDLVSWNSIVTAYARVGDLHTAHDMFDAMPERNVVSWNLMISEYLRGGSPGCAMKLFRNMMKIGIRGNSTTMVNILGACGRSARLNEGRSVHGFMYRTSMKFCVFIDTALVDMYGKCQRVSVARRLFDRMVNRNLVTWNAMVLGHCLHGNPEDGLKLFEEMAAKLRERNGEAGSGKKFKQDEGERKVFLDQITFIGVLCACARAGLLEDANNYFDEMINVFLVRPNFAHYWCLANVYVAAGLIQQAVEILRNMPEDIEDFSSELVVWTNLLATCRFGGDVSLGEQIANYLIDMEPKNESYYRLLLNIYAVAGRWEDVSRIKVLMKEKRLGTFPGCRLVDLKEIVHRLKLGNLLQEGMKETNTVMHKLASEVSLLSTIAAGQSDLRV
ncbi:pentatricopeptide repeat-containing protein At3g51320 isoform X1 [Cucurbita moschata]|uniref:Pentatricopeptide repeat-containing protein At3g51320 isoform X1 n=1 Tax=Cucurbita moschata TaxID=3662 RepID=A0A6J1GGG4_CUCMO|nr:pentatricopeptide repeat-containing protein At3g51320 isoform X1 [Cucurbita moschata]